MVAGYHHFRKHPYQQFHDRHFGRSVPSQGSWATAVRTNEAPFLPGLQHWGSGPIRMQPSKNTGGLNKNPSPSEFWMGFLRHIENTFAWIQKLWSMYVYLVLFSLNTPFKYIMPSSKNCSRKKKNKSMVKSWLVAFYLRMFTHVHQSRMPVTTMDVNSWSFAFHCESGLKVYIIQQCMSLVVLKKRTKKHLLKTNKNTEPGGRGVHDPLQRPAKTDLKKWERKAQEHPRTLFLFWNPWTFWTTTPSRNIHDFQDISRVFLQWLMILFESSEFGWVGQPSMFRCPPAVSFFSGGFPASEVPETTRDLVPLWTLFLLLFGCCFNWPQTEGLGPSLRVGIFWVVRLKSTTQRWWVFSHPSEKICSSKWVVHLPQVGVKI